MKRHLIMFLLALASLSVYAQILPKPVSLTQGQGSLELSSLSTLKVEDQGDFTAEIFQLQEILKAKTGRFLDTAGKTGIAFTVQKTTLPGLPQNAYRLGITPAGILLQSATAEGVYYGIQSVKQLLDQSAGSLSELQITDYPAYPWRGLMIDVSRHFYPLEYLKQQIRLLAYYKMNKFHLHLTDDEGWRIEIKAYPELTQKSAWRDMDRHDKAVLEKTPSNPRIALDPRFLQMVDGRMRYGGYYTQEEIRDLVAYAQAHHVELIPEIDMPGHMMAAIQVFPELTATGKGSWGKVFSAPLTPANEKVFTFVQNVWDEILDLFPSEYIHIGADEVDKTTWKESQACQDLMKANNLADENKLQSWFVERVSNYLKSKGRKVIAWDDALEGGISQDIQVMYWRDWKANIPSEAVAMGHQVIFCPGTPMYLSRRDSAMYDIYHLRSFYDQSLNQQKLIRGAQCNVWGEQVGNCDWASTLIWPRLLAAAELTWTPDEVRNWEDFKRRAQIQRTYLTEKEGMILAPESPFLTVFQTPDADARGIRFHFETEKVEPQLYYTLDGTKPTCKSKPFTDNLLVKGPAILSVGILENGQVLTPYFKRPVDYHKAVGKPVKYLQPWNKAYPAAQEASLTNGLQGDDYYKDIHWQGFTNDLEVIIDMEKAESIRDVSARFMQISKEDVLLPGELTVSTSADGENFKVVASARNDVSAEQPGLVMKDFKVQLKGVKTRYLKVKATNVHPQQFIFTDEIIVH